MVAVAIAVAIGRFVRFWRCASVFMLGKSQSVTDSSLLFVLLPSRSSCFMLIVVVLVLVLVLLLVFVAIAVLFVVLGLLLLLDGTY